MNSWPDGCKNKDLDCKKKKKKKQQQLKPDMELQTGSKSRLNIVTLLI